VAITVAVPAVGEVKVTEHWPDCVVQDVELREPTLPEVRERLIVIPVFPSFVEAVIVDGCVVVTVEGVADKERVGDG